MHIPTTATARRRYALFAATMAVATLLIGWAEASPIEPYRNFVLRHGSVVDLQILDTRQRRRAFQDEQSRFREADRLPPIGQASRLKVPRMHRNCQLQPFGSHFLRSCR